MNYPCMNCGNINNKSTSEIIHLKNGNIEIRCACNWIYFYSSDSRIRNNLKLKELEVLRLKQRTTDTISALQQKLMEVI